MNPMISGMNSLLEDAIIALSLRNMFLTVGKIGHVGPSIVLEDCRIFRLTTFNSLSSMCQLVGFEIFSVNRTRKLGYVNLNWPRCSAQVTESLALTDGSFCQKQNTLYFRLCKIVSL